MNIFSQKKLIKINNELIYVNNKRIMGIINLTPDSFYDGNKYNTIDDIIAQVSKMLDDGADFIDVGGYSSRPGAKSISTEEELKRILEPIRIIRRTFPKSIISIDTFRTEVAQKAIEAGANMINDITAGEGDKGMFKLVAELDVPIIIMHMQGTPQTMQDNPRYEDPVKEISLFFAQKIDELKTLGVKDIIIDPGFGFGKTLENNYEILNKLSFLKFLELPIMIGASRKSMICKALDVSPSLALNGTTVLNTLSLLNGANILRVHDVKEAAEVIKLLTLYDKMSQTGL